MTTQFADLPILEELGGDLRRAMLAADAGTPAAAPFRNRRVSGYSWRTVALALLVLLALAAAAAAATLLVLRGSVIPAPAKKNLQPPMIVKPATVHLAGISAPDPAGGKTWSVRLARSETGLVCTTAGELRGKTFGVTGLDGRFRQLAPGFVDSCGALAAGRPAVLEARVFDAARRGDVRTVVVGVAGKSLRTAELRSGGRTTRMPVSAEGAFVGVVAGYPEDVGIGTTLTFADGSRRTHVFGRDQFVSADPNGALRTESFVTSNTRNARCVRVLSARQHQPFTTGPVLCGAAAGSTYYFDARRVRPGDRSRRQGIYGFSWGRHAARTLFWGVAGSRVKRMTITGPGVRRVLRPTISGAFLAVLPATVDPRSLQVAVLISNGRVEHQRPPYNLGPVPPKR
jgi:hypothetical protein